MSVNPYEPPRFLNSNRRESNRATGSLLMKMGIGSIVAGTCLWVLGWIIVIFSTEDGWPFGDIVGGMAVMAFTLIPTGPAAFWLIGLILLIANTVAKRRHASSQ